MPNAQMLSVWNTYGYTSCKKVHFWMQVRCHVWSVMSSFAFRRLHGGAGALVNTPASRKVTLAGCKLWQLEYLQEALNTTHSSYSAAHVTACVPHRNHVDKPEEWKVVQYLLCRFNRWRLRRLQCFCLLRSQNLTFFWLDYTLPCESINASDFLHILLICNHKFDCFYRIQPAC